VPPSNINNHVLNPENPRSHYEHHFQHAFP
jgi:hypothetical protein